MLCLDSAENFWLKFSNLMFMGWAGPAPKGPPSPNAWTDQVKTG